MRGFRVIDKRTGEYPDLEKTALEEDWAKGLVYCDMEGFALMEDGNLILLDECGNFTYCPFDRFEVILEATKTDNKKKYSSGYPYPSETVTSYSKTMEASE